MSTEKAAIQEDLAPEVVAEETEETTELAAAGEEGSEETEAIEKPKKKGGFQKKLEKQNYLISEQARKIAELEAKVSGKETAPKAVTGKPKIEDFESHADFTEALADWKFEQREQERESKQKAAKQRAEFEAVGKSHAERVAKFKETATDFDEVFEEIEDVDFTPEFTEAVLTSDMSAELIYHLAKNPEEIERINKMSYRDVVKAIGKLEYKLESKKEEKPKLTNAPKPISPVKGKGAVPIKKSIYDEGLTPSEYEALRWEQIKAQKRA